MIPSGVWTGCRRQTFRLLPAMNEPHPTITIDLVEPLVSLPHTPLNISPRFWTAIPRKKFSKASCIRFSFTVYLGTNTFFLDLANENSPSIFQSREAADVRGPRCHHGPRTFWFISTGYADTFGSKPGVSDPEMEQLINEKVDTFWRGVEGGVSKRGQV